MSAIELTTPLRSKIDFFFSLSRHFFKADQGCTAFEYNVLYEPLDLANVRFLPVTPSGHLGDQFPDILNTRVYIADLLLRHQDAIQFARTSLRTASVALIGSCWQVWAILRP